MTYHCDSLSFPQAHLRIYDIVKKIVSARKVEQVNNASLSKEYLHKLFINCQNTGDNKLESTSNIKPPDCTNISSEAIKTWITKPVTTCKQQIKYDKNQMKEIVSIFPLKLELNINIEM